MAVITLLIAVLLPSVRKARQLAANVVCQSNLGQVAKGWQMYFDTYKGACYQGVNANVLYGGWKGYNPPSGWQVGRPLNPSMNLPSDITTAAEAKVFCCPNDRGLTSSVSTSTSYTDFGTSYLTNVMLIGQDQIESRASVVGQAAPLHVEINKRLKQMNINRVTDPSHLILVGDHGWALQWESTNKLKAEWHDIPAYHTVAFVDGHASLIRIRKGLYITPEFRVQPFEELDPMTFAIQREVP